MEQTFEDYLKLHFGKAIDFELRVEFPNGEFGKPKFYIHPQNVNGETWDFEVHGNQLVRV